MDIGCGSGILSFLVAKKYKKSKIIALDKNPDAVETCSVNAASLGLLNIQSINVDILKKEDVDLNL